MANNEDSDCDSFLTQTDTNEHFKKAFHKDKPKKTKMEEKVKVNDEDPKEEVKPKISNDCCNLSDEEEGQSKIERSW